MIDEKKLIELLEDEILRIDTESTPGCGNLYGRDASVMRNTLNYVIDLINEQPKVNGWIPVEERFPKGKGEYLVTYHPRYRDEIHTKFCNVGIDNFRGKTSWAKSKYQKVIAWQPLPEPYEVKGNE